MPYSHYKIKGNRKKYNETKCIQLYLLKCEEVNTKCVNFVSGKKGEHAPLFRVFKGK